MGLSDYRTSGSEHGSTPRPGSEFREPVEVIRARRGEWSKTLEEYGQHFRERSRHFFGLSTETVDLYSPETLASQNVEKTAWGRVRDIFKTDDYDYVSGEYIMIGQVAIAGFMTGMVFGAFKSTRGLRQRFIDYHQTTIFERPSEARSRLTDTLTFHAVRGGVKYGLKVGFVALSYATMTSVITAARNKSGIIEYTTAGFAMGAIWRSNMGLSGALAGACLGAVLGTVGGSCAYGMQRLSGKTYEEIAYWKKVRNMKNIQEKFFRQRQQLEEPSLRMHDVFRKAKILGEETEEPVSEDSPTIAAKAESATSPQVTAITEEAAP